MYFSLCHCYSCPWWSCFFLFRNSIITDNPAVMELSAWENKAWWLNSIKHFKLIKSLQVLLWSVSYSDSVISSQSDQHDSLVLDSLVLASGSMLVLIGFYTLVATNDDRTFISSNITRFIYVFFGQYLIWICFPWNTSDISVFGVWEGGGSLDSLEKKIYCM